MKVPGKNGIVKGVLIQNGIPTPDKPIEIEALQFSSAFVLDISAEREAWIKVREILNNLGSIEYDRLSPLHAYKAFHKQYGRLMDAIYAYQKAAKLDKKYGTKFRNGRNLKII